MSILNCPAIPVTPGDDTGVSADDNVWWIDVMSILHGVYLFSIMYYRDGLLMLPQNALMGRMLSLE